MKKDEGQVRGFVPPAGYNRIKLVGSFDELVSTPFDGEINALCWPRVLDGDFGEVVRRLGAGRGITPIDDARLLALSLTPQGRAARDVLIEDQERLRAHELSPSLDHIDGYSHDMDAGPVATHVQSFHVDSATVEADTYLCTYYGPASEGLRNEDARRRVDVPETRAELLKLYGGKDDAGFLEYLNEHYFDLHYVALAHALPFSFGVGNLWRIACEHPGSRVPPCIHRAPATVQGGAPRLLLIS